MEQASPGKRSLKTLIRKKSIDKLKFYEQKQVFHNDWIILDLLRSVSSQAF